MLLPWSQPPREIVCPVCGAKVQVRRDKNSQFQPKPYCDACGWNVERARKQFLAQVWQTVMIGALISVFACVVTGVRWGAVLMAGWVLLVMVLPVIKRLRQLPASRPAASPKPLAGTGDFGTATLDTVTPRLNIILEGLIVVVSAAAILFLPRELDPARRRFPGVRHELLFVILTTAFAVYQLRLHGVEFFRLASSIWLERHLANRAMIGKGRIIQSNSGTITYEFLDYSSQLQRGTGRDYTLGLYEDMAVSVLYDPDRPSLNMPVVGLQFHRQHGGSS